MRSAMTAGPALAVGVPPAQAREVSPMGRITVRRARRAQETWAARSLDDKLAVVRRFRRHLADAPAPWLEALGRGGTRSQAESLSAELIPLADACRFLERRAKGILGSRRLGAPGRPLWLAGTKARVHREPLGLVLVIGAANYPLLLPGVQVLQAIVAGNGVLLKPGRGGGYAAQLLVSELRRAGLDEDLVTVLGEAPEAAAEAISIGVDKVLLTGSAVTGRRVMAQLAEQLTPSTMELSGCDPIFVRDDADLDLVADAVRFGLTLNDGATCIAPRRLYVGRGRADRLESALARALEGSAVVHLETPVLARARDLVRQALAGGARVVVGSEPNGKGFRPTVLADVPDGAEVLRSDLFAPLLSVVRVGGDEEALAHHARCPYALGASVFGASAGTRAFADRVRAGIVVVNDLIVPTADPRVPFGGRGNSGFGVTRGAEGLLDLTAPKVVTERLGAGHPHFEKPVGGEERLFRGYLKAAHGSGWRQRLVALADAGRSARQMRRKSRSKEETA